MSEQKLEQVNRISVYHDRILKHLILKGPFTNLTEIEGYDNNKQWRTALTQMMHRRFNYVVRETGKDGIKGKIIPTAQFEFLSKAYTLLKGFNMGLENILFDTQFRNKLFRELQRDKTFRGDVNKMVSEGGKEYKKTEEYVKIVSETKERIKKKVVDLTKTTTETPYFNDFS